MATSIKVQKSKLFLAQATVTHSPAIFAQAPVSEAEHILSTLQCYLIRHVSLKYHKWNKIQFY